MYRRTFWVEVLNAFLDEFTPNILVINTGSWYKGDGEFLNGVKRRYGAITKWKQKCRLLHMDCQLIWRTTLPGHTNCQHFDQPATSVEQMTNYISNRSHYNTEKQWGFHWQDFAHQTELITKSLQEKLEFDVDILPAYDLAILRPDAHRYTQDGQYECLHFCALSGVANALTEVLMQLMRLRQQQQQQAVANNATIDSKFLWL